MVATVAVVEVRDAPLTLTPEPVREASATLAVELIVVEPPTVLLTEMVMLKVPERVYGLGLEAVMSNTVPVPPGCVTVPLLVVPSPQLTMMPELGYWLS